MGLAAPQLRSPLRIRFGEYFNHPFDAILNQSGKGWVTLKQRLDDGQIWQDWQDGDRLIGLGFGKTTRYALIDIDAGSPYHSEAGLRDIAWALETIGINSTTLIRSSFSQGWHLYFGFSRPVPTFGLSCLLHQAMEAAGLSIAKGVLEIFPNRKGWQKDAVTVYNRHRLPLQPASGSALLNDDLCPYSTDLGTFLDRLDETAEANDIDLIEELSAEAKRNYNPSKRKGTTATSSPFSPHNPNARKWKKGLEEAIAKGWDGHHQSNILLGQIAEHGRVFLGIDDEYQLADYIAETAIACPGFIPYCRHQREIHAWALRWAKSAMRHRYPYGTRRGGEFKELGKGGLTNEEKRAECLERVADAVNDYQESKREWPTTIRARRKLISELAHCSESTLNKPIYLALWHPNHLEIATQDGDHDADADVDVELPSIPCPEPDSAIQTDAVSHPDNNVRSAHFSQSFHSSSGCTTPAARRQTKTPQTHAASEFQPMTEKFPPKSVPIPGDWLIEPDRPHILLRLESVDEDGEWCRCQDARERQRGCRGSLYFLPELIPAPLAIADESTPPTEEEQA
jgi:hypothetical protein